MSGIDQNSPEQLDLIQQVTKALQEQSKAWEQLAGVLGKNAGVAQQVNEGNKQIQQTSQQAKDAVSGVTDAMREQTGGADDLAAALGRGADASSNMSRSVAEGSDNLIDMAKNLAGVNLAISTLSEMWNATSMIFSSGLDIVTSGFGMLQSAVGVLISPFEGLMKLGAKYNNEMSRKGFAANQELVRSFGDLNGETGQFIKSMKGDLMGATDELASANNSLWAAIGDGPEILQAVTKMAGEFGDQFIRLKDQIKGAADEMFLMGRGMGMSGESMKMMAINAEAAGGSLEDSLQEGMVASAHLANQFGVDVKQIGKNMDKMQKDMATFGHMAPKELAAVAAYSTKLGVSIESLSKTMSAFDTFEGAAQNAGKLAEAFGMNVDVMEMMNAENPAERMDMLRKSFEETGKSVSDLSRHELKLLSESMGGIPVEELKAGLSMSSDELGFGDFADAAEEAAQKITPEEAMEKVAKSIDKLNNAMRDLSGGPLQDFIGGFKHGIMNSKEFKGILGDIGEFLRLFNDAGVRIGNTFAKIFLKDGSKFKKIIEGIFSIDKATKFLEMVENAFNLLFKGLSEGGDPAELASNFFTNIMEAFKTWTGGDGQTGLVDLFKDLLIGALKMVAGIAPKIIKEAAKYITKFAEGLADFFKDPKGSAAGAVGDGLAGAFSQAGSAIMSALPDLMEALKKLFIVLWDNLSPPLIKIWKAAMFAILVKALVTAALQAMVASVVKAVMTKLMGGLAKQADKASEKQFGKSKDLGKKGEGQQGLLKSFQGLIKSLKNFNPMDILKAAFNLGLIVVSFLPSLAIFAAALVGLAIVLIKVPFTALLKSLMVMGAAIGATVVFVKLAAQLEKLKSSFVQAAIGLLAGAAFFAGAALGFGLGIILMNKMIGKIPFGQFMKGLAMISIAILASVGLILVGSAMYASVVQTGLIGVAALGLLAAAAFFAGGVAAFGGGIILMNKMVGSVPFADAMNQFKLLSAAILATVAFVLVGAAIGVPVILGAMALAVIGLPLAAGLMAEGVYVFGKGLKYGMKGFEGVDTVKTIQALQAIKMVLDATIKMVAIAPMFALMGFFGGTKILKKGITTMVDLATNSLIKMVKVIKVINSIPIKDPEKFKMKMEALGKIIAAVQGLAQLGIDAMKIATVASLFSDKGPEEMMQQMSSFITGTIDSIKNLVVKFVEIASGMDENALKGANAIAGIIGSIAQLAGELMGPMQSIVENTGFLDIISGDSASKKMSAMSAAIGDILWELQYHLPKIVKSLMSSVKSIKDPDVFLKKSQALEAMFNGILAMIKAVEKIHKMTTKGTGFFGGDGDADVSILTDMFEVVGDAMGSWQLKWMLQNTSALIKSLPAMKKEDAEGFKTAMDTVMYSVTKAGEFGQFMWDNDGDVALQKLKKTMNWMETNECLPSQVMGSIISEAAAIAVMMKNMDADLGKIHLKPLVEGVLGYDGDRTFTVKAEAVNLSVKLQVAINAEQLATSIVKGNEDLDGFFQTTETAKKELLEGDRGAFGFLGL